MHATADEACAEGDGDCVADAVTLCETEPPFVAVRDAVALRETVLLVVALAVGDVVVGEPVDEDVAVGEFDSEKTADAEGDCDSDDVAEDAMQTEPEVAPTTDEDVPAGHGEHAMLPDRLENVFAGH